MIGNPPKRIRRCRIGDRSRRDIARERLGRLRGGHRGGHTCRLGAQGKLSPRGQVRLPDHRGRLVRLSGVRTRRRTQRLRLRSRADVRGMRVDRRSWLNHWLYYLPWSHVRRVRRRTSRRLVRIQVGHFSMVGLLMIVSLDDLKGSLLLLT